MKNCSEFKIIHQPGSSPAVDFADVKFCYEHDKNKTGELPLDYLLSDPVDILQRVFENEYGVSIELKEIENRLTIPFYEEARQYFPKAIREDLATKDELENNPSSALLEVIIQKYKR